MDETFDEWQARMDGMLNELKFEISELEEGHVSNSQVERYLLGLNCVLWGRAWDLSQPESLDMATRWLIKVMTDLGIEVDND